MNFEEAKIATEQSRMSHSTNDTDDDEGSDKEDRCEATADHHPFSSWMANTNKYASLDAGFWMVLHGAFDNRQDRGLNRCVSHL